jgi:hypothetical protein
LNLYLLSDAAASWQYYPILLVVGLVYLVTLYRTIYHPFDPSIQFILVFVFSSAFVIWLWLNDKIEIEYLISYLFCNAALILGLNIATLLFRRRHIITPNKPLFTQQQLKRLRLFNRLVATLVLATFAYGLLNNALALFSENPVLDRVALSKANRWLTVIFFGTVPAGLSSSILLLAITNFQRSSRKRMKNLMPFVTSLIFLLALASQGGKSAIFSTLFSLGCVVVYLKSRGYPVPRILKKGPLLLLPLGFAYFIYIVSRPGTGDDAWWYKLTLRLIGSGDTYIYLFVEQQYETLKFIYNPITYLLHTVTTVFGIKFIPYNIGVALYGGSTGDYSGFGPNSHHVAEGMIFFGIIFAPLYSLCVGTLVGWMRELFRGRRGVSGFLLFAVLFINSSIAPIDITYWLFVILSSALILYPIYFVTTLAVPLALPQTQLKKKAYAEIY